MVEESERMIEDLQLQDKRNTPSQKLSGGMKRKLRLVNILLVVYVHHLFG